MVRKNLLKKFLVSVVTIGFSVFAVVPTNVFAKNFGPYNWTGSWYSTDSGTIARSVKDNTSSVRVHCTSTTYGLSFRLKVYGGDEYYGPMYSLTYNGKTTPEYAFSNDTEWYMINYVKENNKRIAALFSSNVSGRGEAAGVWNPDTTNNDGSI